jgi:hypothetical protein
MQKKKKNDAGTSGASQPARTSDLAESSIGPNGVEWWKPGCVIGNRKLGAERRIASFLWFKLNVGDLFTMKLLREELGDGEDAEAAEQLNRRLRSLRKDGWILDSIKDDRSLPTDAYRLERKGKKIWLGEPRENKSISQRTRRLVFDRDGYRCVLCGIGGSEPYPGEPDSKAKLTVGHRLAQERSGSIDLENLRTECARCNEPLRHELRNPESLDEVLAEIRILRKTDLQLLLEWMQTGARSRSKLDRVYDRARLLSPAERVQLITALKTMVG